MKKGVIFGKFYPLHAGHKYLIDTALSQVDLLTIVVTGKKGQKIPSRLRAKWLSYIYPTVKIKLIYHSIANDDDEKWASETTKWIGYKPDVVFTSEERWGDHYAALLGAKHVSVDRKKFPVSGTMIRRNPVLFLKYLDPVVRKYFEAKIREAKTRGAKYKIDERIL